MYERKIGKFIASRRKEMGYTQEHLGRMLGISGKVISKWENGTCLPDILILNDLSKLLGVTTTELLDAKDSEDIIIKQ